MKYLSVEEILSIHDLLIETHGGVFGIRDLGLLYSVAERPKLAVFGKEFYPTVFLKAAAYIEAIATYHVFADGNKRTSFLVASTFLGINGYDLQVSNPKAFQFTLDIALKKRTMEEIAEWFQMFSKKV